MSQSSRLEGAGSRLVLTVLLLAALVTTAGCQLHGPPERSATPLGPPRAGEVFLVRGLLGSFSTGMDQLQRELARRGVRAVALQHTEGASAAQWIIDHYSASAGPIILVGHSLGGDEAVSMAARLQHANVPVALLITLDPVGAGSVPANVRQATNYYYHDGLMALPLFRGMPLKTSSGPGSALQNVDLSHNPDLSEPGLDHFSIDNNDRLQGMIVAQILSVCPPERDSPRAIRASVTMAPGRP